MAVAGYDLRKLLCYPNHLASAVFDVHLVYFILLEQCLSKLKGVYLCFL